MSAPSPSPPECTLVSSQDILQFLMAIAYSGCKDDNSNPICIAVHNAQKPGASLKTLADELDKINENDLVNWLQGPGQQQAQRIGTTLLMPLKCYLAPSGDNRGVANAEIDALARIKSWYIQKYLESFGKAKVPGVNFSTSDAHKIRLNIDRLTCSKSDTIWFGVSIAVVAALLFLLLGWLLGHWRGKVSCIKHLTERVSQIATAVGTASGST